MVLLGRGIKRFSKEYYDDNCTAERQFRLNEEKAKMQDNVLGCCEWMNVFTELVR